MTLVFISAFSPSSFLMSIPSYLIYFSYFLQISAFFIRIFFFPCDDTRIRTNEDQAHERTVYLPDHSHSDSVVFFSAASHCLLFCEYTTNAFMTPPFYTLISRHSPLRTTESMLTFMIITLSDDTRILTNERQAHERTVYLLEDHKVTTVTLWCSSQRFSPSPFFHEYTINVFFVRINLFDFR